MDYGLTIHPEDSAPSSVAGKSLWRLEEAVVGAIKQLEPFMDSLTAACRTTAGDIARFRQALAVAGVAPSPSVNSPSPSAGPPPTEPAPAEPSPDTTTGEFALAHLRRLFGDFLARRPGTRLGEDPEELHQMRVAARRLRAVIRLFRPALAPSFGQLSDELRWLAGALGDVRDLQVEREWLGSILEAAPDETAALQPLLDRLDERIVQAQESVVTALESPRFEGLVRQMTVALDVAYAAAEEASVPVEAFAGQALRKRFKSVRKQASRLSVESPDSDLHDLRIKTKRLRYAAETFQPLYAARVRGLVKPAKALQDLLGEHQDGVFACRWLHDNAVKDAAQLPPETLIQVGELSALRRREMDRIRRQWPRSYRKLGKAWKRAEKEIS